MNQIELREVRVFLALADELHFGRCAQRLRVSQSQVSQTVARLERQLGGQLFARTSRRVELTDRGRHLVRAVADPHSALLRAFDEVRHRDEAVDGELRLGVVAAVSGGPRLLEIIAAFELQFPGCRIAVVDLALDDMVGMLRRGDVDVAALRQPVDAPDLTRGPTLVTENRVLAVGRTHPLANRQSVTLDDIADYGVAYVPGMPECMDTHLTPRFAPDGRPIRRIVAVTTLPEVLAAVAKGTIVHSTVTALREYHAHPQIIYLPLVGAPPSSTALMWPRTTYDPRVAAFAAVAAEVLAVPTDDNQRAATA